MAKNKGTDGQGTSKSIAEREGKKVKKTYRHAGRDDGQTSMVPVVDMEDFLNGEVFTGHHVEISGVTFEALEDGNKLTLVSATVASLAKFVGQAPNVFIGMGHIINPHFVSPLTGVWHDQQMVMWEHLRSSLGEDGVSRIATRMNIKHKLATPFVQEKAEVLQFVGDTDEIWERATEGDPSKIALAFASMTKETPAEIRIGREQRYGVVLGIFFGGRNGRTDELTLQLGHVGDKAELAKKIIFRTSLWCKFGKLPDENMVPSGAHFSDSIKALYDFLISLDRKVRDSIMKGMYHAFARITTEQKPVVVDMADQRKLKAVTLNQQAPKEQANEELPPVTVAVTADTVMPAPMTEVVHDGLIGFIAGLKEGGATDREIGTAIAVFMKVKASVAKSA